MIGSRLSDYNSPLFLAWQLTNKCGCKCLHCCEESGPDKRWKDELTRDEALDLTRQIVQSGISYVAFGGGEPMEVPFFWDIVEGLTKGEVPVKIETNGLVIDEAAADRLTRLAVSSIQISVDGACAATHERLRPQGSFEGALGAMRRLSKRGLGPEFVFVPTRVNIAEAADAYELAASVGARVFVTGPMMRLGRAAEAWGSLAPSPEEWAACAETLKERAKKLKDSVKLSIYPWDIQHEIKTRIESPQAMLLVVPNGKVKLLNALPWAPGDMRKQDLLGAWRSVVAAWSNPKVLEFCERASKDATLLRHANECWDVEAVAQKA
jgi:MoaA/NifB/PqqE/SkfB family radical SAM enzyme